MVRTCSITCRTLEAVKGCTITILSTLCLHTLFQGRLWVFFFSGTFAAIKVSNGQFPDLKTDLIKMKL